MSHPPSRLGELLQRGEFVVTAELSAIDSPDPAVTIARASRLRAHADAINCTDNTGAHVHLSPLAAAHLLAEAGIEPIMQLTTRDRNRLGLQADLLGAAALGVRNVIMMSGDDVSAGDHPEARSIYDIDSIQLVQIARTMRDRGIYLSGRKLDAPPSFFIGAVENPFAPPIAFRPARLQKKVEAGAEFIQTQLVFNLRGLADFMARVRDLGLLERVAIIPSVAVPRSARGARFMREKVPGVFVPESIVRRIEGVPTERQAQEGIRIAVELVSGLREIPGVRGVHVIAIRWDEGVLAVVEEAGLLPRPAAGPGPGVRVAALPEGA
ncbi:MAG TPA: methylenetetrahydrofolate reductase [Candidatus Limnocylindrales bacterium]|nr:methylenetetrahydrofolate reductase [Candidatus Limnocylindrales bacterium]